MSERDIKKRNSKIVQRSYLARDFNSFKRELMNHAQTFFPEQISDFSESGLGGLFVDMIAYVGDSMSYYLDHQFNELRWQDAIEVENIKKHIELSGVDIHGASPSSVYVNVYIKMPYEIDAANQNKKTYKNSAMPIIKAGTRFSSNNGITFNLMDTLDFSERTIDGKQYLFEKNNPKPLDDNSKIDIVYLSGICVSGEITTETFSISDSFLPFNEITLRESNVSLIESVKDSDGNSYYEVDNLSQDNIFQISSNKKLSNNSSEEVISLLPAPYRFTRQMDPETFLTTLMFGGGDSLADDNDILPDPSDLSMPLYGKKTFSKFALDPNALLKTHTLGIAPRNTILSVKYRHGGGFTHNVSSEAINEITFLDIEFPQDVSREDAIMIRSSISILNKEKAAGGSRAPTLNDFRQQIPVARNSQKRIVTKEDLLARIYSLPSPLGRVFRAALSEAPNSNGQIEIVLVSRDFDGTLTSFGTMETTSNDLSTSPDSLKLNLKTYLDSFRMINDSYIIMDAAIHNFGVNINVIATPGVQKETVAQSIITNLKEILTIEKFHINQPLSLGDISYAVLSSDGVSSLDSSGNRKAITIESLTQIDMMIKTYFRIA